MSEFIAALPMYDWPEARAETDALWAAIRDHLRGQGIDAPERLARRNADIPAVPGGIRDAAGRIIAPDPATLPPDGFDVHTLWRHPKLLFAQTCWGPMEMGLADHVRVVGQPDYSAFEGGQGEEYSSAVLMRRASAPSPLRGGSSRAADRGGGGGEALRPSRLQQTSRPPPRLASQAMLADPPRKGEGDAPPSSDGSSLIPHDRLRGARFAYNGPDSMSGILALSRDLAALGESLDMFADRVETGAHRASVVAVAEGRADVCAVDCRTWDLIRRFEPAAAKVEIVGWTGRRKGLPYVASRSAPPCRLPASLL
jgi:ABC-type phosphate/phosphonate transport system substrate-binding protein